MCFKPIPKSVLVENLSLIVLGLSPINLIYNGIEVGLILWWHKNLLIVKICFQFSALFFIQSKLVEIMPIKTPSKKMFF